jgi:hypothetical protein
VLQLPCQFPVSEPYGLDVVHVQVAESQKSAGQRVGHRGLFVGWEGGLAGESTARATRWAASLWTSFSVRVRFSPLKETREERRIGLSTRPAPGASGTNSFFSSGVIRPDASLPPSTAGSIRRPTPVVARTDGA